MSDPVPPEVVAAAKATFGVVPSPEILEGMFLDCKACGHWKKGPLTKMEAIDWLRVHRCARIWSAPHLKVRCESTCPNPCGAT